MFIFTSLLIFLLTLLILVVIHEFGHFLAAKKFNIKVLEFGFGIPPKVWGKKIGETLVSLNWLPFGGFVRLLGEDEMDKEILENKRSFAAQKVEKRIIVVLAGVVMNLILAWLLFYVSLIAQDFKIIYPAIEPVLVIDRVEKGYPAYEANLNSGDQILSIDGKKITDISEAISLIKNKNGPLELEIASIDGANKRKINITPKKISETEQRIGVTFSPLPFKKYETLQEKIFSGITYSFDAAKNTFLGLAKVFSDLGSRDFQKASQSVAGPVGLAVITKNIVSIGSEATLLYIWFMGILSLTLAIFNILPIPALDGGRLFFLLWEAVSGKKIKPEIERNIHAIGMVCLLTLIALITYSDLTKINFAKILNFFLPIN